MYCFTVFSTSMQVQPRSKLMPAMYYAQNNPSQSGYLRKRFPKINLFPRQAVFRFKVLFYIGNNSIPKFIFRLSRFPVYRGSGLGRFHCTYTHTHTHARTHARCAFVGLCNKLYKTLGTYIKIKEKLYALFNHS